MMIFCRKNAFHWMNTGQVMNNTLPKSVEYLKIKHPKVQDLGLIRIVHLNLSFFYFFFCVVPFHQLLPTTVQDSWPWIHLWADNVVPGWRIWQIFTVMWAMFFVHRNLKVRLSAILWSNSMVYSLICVLSSSSGTNSSSLQQI